MAIETPVEMIGGFSALSGRGSWITFGSYGDFPVNLPDFRIPWLWEHRGGSRPMSCSSFRFSRWKHRAALRGLSSVWPAALSLSFSPPPVCRPSRWAPSGCALSTKWGETVEWHCLCSGEEDRLVNHGLLELAFVSLVSLLCCTFSLVSSTLSDIVTLDGVTKQYMKMSTIVIKACYCRLIL